MPAAGQTREPTPVQTIVASSTVAASSTFLQHLQLPQDLQLLLREVRYSRRFRIHQVCSQLQKLLSNPLGASAGTAQPGTTGQESGAQGASQQSGGQESQACCPGSTSRIREYDTVYCRCNTPASGNRWRSLLLHAAKEERY